MPYEMSRRNVLRSLIAGSAGAGGSSAGAHGAAAAAADNPTGRCEVFPKAVEGPYYFDPRQVRSDISEGRPGLPLQLALEVATAPDCLPVANARVDIWHADARGVYSGYPGQGDDRSISATGETYLRGTQFTDEQGRVGFSTIYPGWYPGRTPHIHVKVFLDQATLVTSQVYFPDDVSAKVYREADAYLARSQADTTNATDFLFLASSNQTGSILAMSDGPPLQGTLRIAVRTDKTRAGGGTIWDWFRRG